MNKNNHQRLPLEVDAATLRAYLDYALPEDEREQLSQMLAQSADARLALANLRQDIEQTQAALTILSPSNSDLPAASQALQRLQQGFEANQAAKKNTPFERIRAMFTKSTISRNKPAFTALVFVLTVALAFSFAPVRAFAGDFLKIFRVQEVRVVPVDMNRLENLESNEEFGDLMAQFSPESETIVDGGEPQDVASLAEAAGLVSYPIAEIGAVPADAGDRTSISVQQESVHQLSVDPDLAEAIFEAAGIELDLPDSLRDTPVTITRPDAVFQKWGDETDPNLGFVQLETPQFEYPDDLDLDALGVAVLQMLGRSEAEARAFAATVDWSNTLILPIPADENIEAIEVSVNGASGTYLHSTSPENDENGLMWHKDGMTYMIMGNYDQAQLVEIAQSVE